MLFSNQVQFELVANVRVLQGLVITNVFHQFVEHCVRVLAGEHPLSWVPFGVTHSVGPPIVMHFVFREELAFDWVGVRVLTTEVDHLHDLGLLALCGARLALRLCSHLRLLHHGVMAILSVEVKRIDWLLAARIAHLLFMNACLLS